MSAMRQLILLLIFALLVSLIQPCFGSLMKVTVDRDSIFTPGKLQINVSLTDDAIIKSDYGIRVSIFAGDNLVKKEIFAVSEFVELSFDFPRQRARMDGRCMVELFQDDKFVESAGRSLTLWPSPGLNLEVTANNKIWVYDTSGRTKDIIKSFGLDPVDAKFQSVRDFIQPDIIVVGEQLSESDLKNLFEYIKSVKTKPYVIFLKQNEFPVSFQGVTVATAKQKGRVDCDDENPLLLDIRDSDLNEKVKNAWPLIIKQRDNKELLLKSSITSVQENKESVVSCLAEVLDDSIRGVCCQLPIVEGFDADPVSVMLMRNLLNHALREIDSSVPVIYHKRLSPEPLSRKQMGELLKYAQTFVTEDRQLWFLWVLYNRRYEGQDNYRVVVYFTPETTSGRIRKGVCATFSYRAPSISQEELDKQIKKFGGKIRIPEDHLHPYRQVSLANEPFDEILKVPDNSMLIPFEKSPDVTDQEAVAVVDFLRNHPGDSKFMFYGLEKDEPVKSIKKEGGKLIVVTGVQEGMMAGSGREIECIKNGDSYKLLGVTFWLS